MFSFGLFSSYIPYLVLAIIYAVSFFTFSVNKYAGNVEELENQTTITIDSYQFESNTFNNKTINIYNEFYCKNEADKHSIRCLDCLLSYFVPIDLQSEIYPITTPLYSNPPPGNII